MKKNKALLENLYATFMVILGLSFTAFFIYKMETCGKNDKPSTVNNSPSNSSSSSYPVEHTIASEGFVGFTSLDDLKQATSMFHDIEALDKFIAKKVAMRSATIFETDEIVFLEEVDGIVDRSVKIRRKGDAESFWTTREAIKK